MMKIEYTKKENHQFCVATYRVCGGQPSYAIKTDEGCTIIYDDYTPNHDDHAGWLREVQEAEVLFYPGDSITITF